MTGNDLGCQKHWRGSFTPLHNFRDGIQKAAQRHEGHAYALFHALVLLSLVSTAALLLISLVCSC